MLWRTEGLKPRLEGGTVLHQSRKMKAKKKKKKKEKKKKRGVIRRRVRRRWAWTAFWKT
jgi:hypothetical protein